jgi:hypothetical protein
MTTMALGQSKWKSLKSANFKISYPSDWILEEDTQIGAKFVLYTPDNSDDFRENINLMIQDLTGYGLDLDSYTEISKQQLPQIFEETKIVLSEKRTKNNQEYQRIIYSGRQAQFHLKFEQYYWVINDKAYILTLTCAKDQFDNYQKIGEKIMDSFQLKL